MARYNPELMRIDDDQEQPKRVFGTRTDTSQITEQQMYEASRDAAIELGVDSETLAYEAGLAGEQLAGGEGIGLADGALAGCVAVDISADSTLSSAAYGAFVGCIIIGGIAYGASNYFDWYEISCSINVHV